MFESYTNLQNLEYPKHNKLYYNKKYYNKKYILYKYNK